MSCRNQEEVDAFWSNDPDAEKSQRVMQAMLNMKKIEIGELERAVPQA